MNTNTTPCKYKEPTNTPNNGKITVRDNGKITASQNADNAPVTTSNAKITPATVRFVVYCQALSICQTFADKDTAHAFATKLGQDHPQAHIEKAQVSLFFDDWGDDETDANSTGGKHEQD